MCIISVTIQKDVYKRQLNAFAVSDFIIQLFCFTVPGFRRNRRKIALKLILSLYVYFLKRIFDFIYYCFIILIVGGLKHYSEKRLFCCLRVHKEVCVAVLAFNVLFLWTSCKRDKLRFCAVMLINVIIMYCYVCLLYTS